MDILQIETLEKLINPQHLTTFVVIWFFIKKQVSEHFKSIESSLDAISKNLNSLEDAIINLETNHSLRLDELSGRVQKLEGR